MKKSAAENIHSTLFSILFFSVLLLQLTAPDLQLDSISDRFLWRLPLIEKINAFRYTAGDSIFNKGLRGREDWLFYTGDYSIHDYQKTAPIGPRRLQSLAQVLTSLDKHTAAYGGMLLVVIPPDKNTIYPEYMPAQIPVIGQTSRLDQLMEFLQKNTKLNLVDLRPVFTAASRSAQIYYKSDAHWNCLGAYHAANEILGRVSTAHPEVQSLPLSAYETGVMLDGTLDISRAMGLTLQEESITLTPKIAAGSLSHEPYPPYAAMQTAVNSQTSLPRALVIHDSFYPECLHQFIEPQFSRVIFSHYGESLLADYLDVIDSEKPDVVLVEFAERHIEYFFTLITRDVR